MTITRLSMTAIISTLFISGCGDETFQSAPVQPPPQGIEQKTEPAETCTKSISHFRDALEKTDTFEKFVGVEDEIKKCGYAKELQTQLEINTDRVLRAEIDRAQQKNDLERLAQIERILKSLDLPKRTYWPLRTLPGKIADARYWVVNNLYCESGYRITSLQDNRDFMRRISEDPHLTQEERQGALNTAYARHEALLEQKFGDIATLDKYYHAEDEVTEDKYLPSERKRLFLNHYAKQRAELIQYAYSYRPFYDYQEHRQKILNDKHLTESERNYWLDEMEKYKARWDKRRNKN